MARREFSMRANKQCGTCPFRDMIAADVDAPEPGKQIVTDEMVDAGLKAYYETDMRSADAEYLVETIFLAMTSAQERRQ